MTLNFIQIESKTGIKEFELYNGDMSNLPFNVDLLCISAFYKDYTPTDKSIIGQLFKKGIDVNSLSKKNLYDFRDNLGIWVSSKSKGTFFKNIICVEISGANQSLKDVITNLFAVISFLEIQGNKNSSIAIPLIGTGDQSLDPEMVTDILLDTSVEFLKYSRYLNKVYFVVRNDEKAQLLNRQMNIKLGRAKVKSPKGELAALLRKDLNNNIDALIDRYENEEVFKDSWNQPHSFLIHDFHNFVKGLAI